MKKYLFRSICRGIFGLCAVVIFWGICETGVSATLYDELPPERKSLYDQLSQGNQQKLENFRNAALIELHPKAGTRDKNHAIQVFSAFLTDAKTFQESIPGLLKDKTIIECIMGLAFLDDGSIAVNTQSLRLFLNLCKSSLNGKFQYLRFSPCKDKTGIKTHFSNFTPCFYNQWTTRKLTQTGTYNQTNVSSPIAADQAPLFIQLSGQPPVAKKNSRLFASQATDDSQCPLPLKKRSIGSPSSLANSSLPAPPNIQTTSTEVGTNDSDGSTTKILNPRCIKTLCIPCYLCASLYNGEDGQTTVLNATVNPTLPSRYPDLRRQLSEYFKKTDPKM